jgi:uncharacterized protein (DUF2147 family)
MRELLLTGCLLFALNALGQDVLGSWKTIDDQTGKARSIVKIYKEEDGKVYGRIDQILNPERRDALCGECEGEDKDKPIEGMVIIRGLEKDGDQYNSGKILDPESGNLYKCYIELEDPNKLKVRGYIGLSVIGRTQYWHRVE